MISRINRLLVDLLWQYPDPAMIKKAIKWLPNTEYRRALIDDVLHDKPQAALNILKKLDATWPVNKRLEYLSLRIGKKSRTGKYQGLNLHAIVPVTPTASIIDTTKKYGLQPHFGELENLIRRHNLTVGAEIGVFMGLHASHLLEACRNINLFCVDLYDNIKGNGYDNLNRSDFDSLFASVSKRMNKYRRATFIRKPSTKAAKDFQDKSLDFIFIDANHNYLPVKQDLAAWGDKVRPGGIISGHDYDNPDWPGVKRAVDEWAAKTKRTIKRGKETFWYTIA